MGADEAQRRLAAVARAQQGLIDHAQGRAAGLSASAVDRAVAAERLERVHHGVFRVAGAPISWEQEVLAAVLAAGGDAVASHRSAAVLWGLLDHDDTVELTVSRSRLPRPAGVVVHRSRDLDPRWCTRRRAIPVTKPVRTLVDLGAVVPRATVEDALERALVARLVTIAAVEHGRSLHARPGRRGCGVLGEVLDRRAFGARPPDSVLEARMAALLDRHGCPSPAFQHEVRVDGRFVARVDFAYPDACLAIEVDGLDAHGSAPALQADLARQNSLVRLGWTVLRFTWDDVVRRPASVAAAVTAVLRRLS